MKRSEMLDMIARTLEDINIENYYDEKGSNWCANLILMEIEENGMLPPLTENLKNGKGYGWEPEDEKKWDDKTN